MDNLRADEEITVELPLPAEFRAPVGGSGVVLRPYLVVLSGEQVGRMFRLDEGELTVGRTLGADIVIADAGMSRNHARFSLLPDNKVLLVDLDSTNGTWVDGRRHQRGVLHEGERVLLGTSTVLKLGYRDPAEASAVGHLYESATRDPLTGLFNRRWFAEQLDREVAWHRRQGRPLSLILFDLDHFKAINDTFGHLAGDAVLRQLGTVCQRQCRTEDAMVRYGGDEFACLLRETAAAGGVVVARRLCAAISHARFSHTDCGRELVIPTTVSVGLATQQGAELGEPGALIADADRQLFRAKAEGRNRVTSGLGAP
jgi:diguanylate cyclase (GGDEF)-like protein